MDISIKEFLIANVSNLSIESISKYARPRITSEGEHVYQKLTLEYLSGREKLEFDFYLKQKTRNKSQEDLSLNFSKEESYTGERLQFCINSADSVYLKFKFSGLPHESFFLPVLNLNRNVYSFLDPPTFGLEVLEIEYRPDWLTQLKWSQSLGRKSNYSLPDLEPYSKYAEPEDILSDSTVEQLTGALLEKEPLFNPHLISNPALCISGATEEELKSIVKTLVAPFNCSSAYYYAQSRNPSYINTRYDEYRYPEIGRLTKEFLSACVRKISKTIKVTGSYNSYTSGSRELASSYEQKPREIVVKLETNSSASSRLRAIKNMLDLLDSWNSEDFSSDEYKKKALEIIRKLKDR